MTAAPSIPGDLRAAFEAHAERLGPFGRRLVHFPSIGSTNDEASRLANNGAPEGTIVVADAQTAGRGRMGHTWFSPQGAGLYVSIVLRPRSGSVLAAPDAAGLLTLMAGVAVADGVRAASGLDAAIKWPNDIVVPSSPPGVPRPEPTADARAPAGDGPGWRKIAGILAEGFLTSGTLLHVVLGVGVNLARATYPPDLAGHTSSIEGETGEPVERSRVLVELLAALSREHTAIEAGDVDGLLTRWRARSPSSTGARIAWSAGDGLPRTGVTAGIDDRGALLARTPTGTEIIRAGTVTWL